MLNIEQSKHFIQSANINFLIGSGLSMPYLSTLGQIEQWLTEINTMSPIDEVSRNTFLISKLSIYKKYFMDVIYPNTLNFNDEEKEKQYRDVFSSYQSFISLWAEIIAKRNNALLPKQINIFTTNIDLFVERAAEKTNVEFNDGFKGALEPLFDEGNFQKSYSKTSSYFSHTTEIPVFNLLKIHGSIHWKKYGEHSIEIACDRQLSSIQKIYETVNSIDKSYFVDIEEDDNLHAINTKALTLVLRHKKQNPENSIANDICQKLQDFENAYNEIIMVNPTKQKFATTVLDMHFYELMRLYSNALEKENSILFVQGFSFADEHIAQITRRAANTNPTLLIIVFVYSDKGKERFQKNLHLEHGLSKYNNIWLVTPEEFRNANRKKDGENDGYNTELNDTFKKFDFNTINEVYRRIAHLIPVKHYGK